MGVFDRFEKGIERAVNGAFAKAFKSEVQPVEIASQLRRAADERAAVVGRGRTLVPNAFVVELGSTDHDRLYDYEDELSKEFANNLRAHAEQQGYAFVGPVTVRVRGDPGPGDRPVPGAHRHGQGPPARAPAPRRRRSRATPRPPGPSVLHAREMHAERQQDHEAGRRPWLDIDGHAYPLTSSSTVIGRGNEADIVIDDPGVSRKHAEIRVTTDGPHLVATLRDLGSTNGTFLDAQRIGAAELGNGSTITIGRTRAVYRSGER